VRVDFNYLLAFKSILAAHIVRACLGFRKLAGLVHKNGFGMAYLYGMRWLAKAIA
jgi:hypothetical protein